MTTFLLSVPFDLVWLVNFYSDTNEPLNWMSFRPNCEVVKKEENCQSKKIKNYWSFDVSKGVFTTESNF